MTGNKSVKALRQYERTTEEQFQAVGHSISHMQTFDPQSTIETVSTSQVKEETLLKTECGVIQVEEEKVITKTDAHQDPCKEKAAALAGEMQKALPSISGNLNHCTFNFNFS